MTHFGRWFRAAHGLLPNGIAASGYVPNAKVFVSSATQTRRQRAEVAARAPSFGRTRIA
jgi:hypothetical protein